MKDLASCNVISEYNPLYMRTLLFRSIPLVFLSVVMSSMAHAASMPMTDLSVGHQGADVRWLQEYLLSNSSGSAALKLKTVGATGYYGHLTEQALAEYQRDTGIAPARGYFGPKTRAFISSRSVSYHLPLFSGKISAVNTGCFVDGICSVTIGDKKVVLLAGFRVTHPPVGKNNSSDLIKWLYNFYKLPSFFIARTGFTSESSSDFTMSFVAALYFLKCSASLCELYASLSAYTSTIVILQASVLSE